MEKFCFLFAVVFVSACGMSQSEKLDIAQRACAAIYATADDEKLERLRILNEARLKLEDKPHIFDSDIEEYKRWGLCELYVLNDANLAKEIKRRKEAYGVVERATELGREYFTAEIFTVMGEYLIATAISYDRKDSHTVIDTATMTGFTGRVEGIGRANDGKYYRIEAKALAGKYEGLVRTWDLNGQLAEEADFANGTMEGVWRQWFESGVLKQEGSYLKGRAEGVFRNWYESGQLESEANYVDGVKQGLERTWHENGQLKTQANYVKGEQDGEMQTWDENGKTLSDIVDEIIKDLINSGSG